MGKIVPRPEQLPDLRRGDEEPHPAWAFTVGILYVFGTRPGWQLLRQLEGAIRRYTADPTALLRLLRERQSDVIELPPADK